MFWLNISFNVTEVDNDNIQRQQESDNGSDNSFGEQICRNIVQLKKKRKQ